MGVIVLKHLAREFDMDPFRLRQVLRKEFGYAAGRRWRWDEKADAGELKLVREFLTGRRGGQKANASSSNTEKSTMTAKSSGKRSAKANSESPAADLSEQVTIARSGARKSSSAYVEQLREGLKDGDEFIKRTSEKLSRLREVRETVVLGDDTTARQKLSKVKRKMRDVGKSGDSPNPKK